MNGERGSEWQMNLEMHHSANYHAPLNGQWKRYERI